MDEGYPKQRRYPYELKIANATPEGFQPAADFRKFLKTNGHIHTNGGGWVSNNANVASTVFVGPYAIVRGGTVSGNARIDGFAMVDGGNISGNAIVRGNACVYNATLSNSAIVEGNAWMEGGSVSSTANIKGNAMLFAGNFGGSVVVGGDAEIGSCSTAGVYLQFPYWRNGRSECDGKGASDASNIDINASFTNFSAATMAFSTTPNCTVTTASTAKKAGQEEDPSSDVSLNIYPNPTGGNLTVSFMQTEQEKVTVSLFDINGHEVGIITDKTYDVGRIDLEYNCSNLIPGVYLLRIQTGNDYVTKSFIKK
jgi:carbonic anhydrase/acetyltransferase-like protein (isoleucine patch superfamily)